LSENFGPKTQNLGLEIAYCWGNLGGKLSIHNLLCRKRQPLREIPASETLLTHDTAHNVDVATWTKCGKENTWPGLDFT